MEIIIFFSILIAVLAVLTSIILVRRMNDNRSIGASKTKSWLPFPS